MVAIPVVHFITAVPSPFIGGYFAGSRLAATGGRAILVGLTMSAMLAVPVAGVLMVPALLLDLGAPFILIGSAGYVVWCAMLATVGAAMGGSSVRRQSAKTARPARP
jgi:uncharacterized membrane protein